MLNQQQRKEEAIKRLEFLKKNGMSYAPALNCFKEGKDVPMFEYQGGPFKAVYYQLYLNGSDEEYKRIIEAKEHFEKEHDCTIYMILINHTRMGKMITMFCVTQYDDDKDELKMQWDNLKEGYALSYAYLDNDYQMYDMGDIKFEYDKLCGGIYRVG